MSISIPYAFNLLKLLTTAEEDIKEGRYSEAKDFFQEFKHDRRIQNQPIAKCPELP